MSASKDGNSGREPTTQDADYIAPRNALFETLKKKQDAWIAQQIRQEIEIKYARGQNKPTRTLAGKSWQTTPASVARQVSIRSELDRWIVAQVDGQPWDIGRPLERSCTLELLGFDNPEGKKAFWKSSAHVLGSAAEQRFGCLLNEGMARQDGFIHEWGMPEASGTTNDGQTTTTKSATITKADFKPLLRLAHKIINKGTPFERLQVSKQDLIAMFSYNKYKLHAIERMDENETAVVYRCGNHVDLCEGPLISNMGQVKAFELGKNSSSYFLSDASNDSLQRIHGISFPNKKALEEHNEWLRQASLRDHRKIGRDQELFFFHSTVSPGSAFFLPRGQIIYNTLMAYMRDEYWKRGYQEVTTPNMFNSALWKQSGHWQHYKDDMFRFNVEKDEWALKPMNCPGHCVVFGHRERTFRELPLRISEFGILHRNELSGALTGLTRVRRFVQDDTHIFCLESQIEQEVKNVLDWLTEFYHRIFGFKFKVRLSTMPESHLGDLATWQRAEAQLTKALEMLKSEMGIPWELNPGDGAFYGPKIDITICDALNRDHQCASIQLDFQLPQQFNLQYRTDEQFIKPQSDITPHKDENGADSVDQNIKGTTQEIKKISDHRIEHDGLGDKQESSPPKVNGEKDTDHLENGSATATNQPLDVGNVSSQADDRNQESKANPATEGIEFHRRELTRGYARPVMIHRGLLGSFERFTAILCEHFAGKWPFWISPRQILIVPVTSVFNDYAVKVQDVFRQHNLRTDVELSSSTMTKKIRTGQLQDYNFIFVLGQQEYDSQSVNIRNRDDPTTHRRRDPVPIDKALRMLCSLRDERRLSSLFSFA